MSETEIKIGLRAEVKHLQNASLSDIRAYFANKGIYPTDEDDEDLFYESSEEVRFVPYITKNKVYLTYEFVSKYMVDFDMYRCSAGMFTDKLTMFSAIFGIPKHEVEFFAYQWYNGTDDPIVDW